MKCKKFINNIWKYKNVILPKLQKILENIQSSKTRQLKVSQNTYCNLNIMNMGEMFQENRYNRPYSKNISEPYKWKITIVVTVVGIEIIIELVVVTVIVVYIDFF